MQKQPQPDLERLLAEARKRPAMTADEIAAQRKSWVIGEMLLDHPKMTRAEVVELYDRLIS